MRHWADAWHCRCKMDRLERTLTATQHPQARAGASFLSHGDSVHSVWAEQDSSKAGLLLCTHHASIKRGKFQGRICRSEADSD